MRRRHFLAGLTGVTGILAGCLNDLETATADIRLQGFSAATTLAVRNRNGDVSVSTSADTPAACSITKRTRRGVDLEQVSISQTHDEDVLELEPDLPAGVSFSDVSLDLDISLPAGSQVGLVETANGSVTVTGGRGDATLRSTNGGVRARNVDGFVTARTSNGDVTVTSPAGIAGAESTNGSVSIDVPAIRDDVTIRTTNGSIDAALAGTLNARIEASTVNGSVTVTGVQLATADIADKRVTGVLGDGGPTAEFSTINGSVELRTLSGKTTG